MPRNSRWTEEENEILLGALAQYGDRPSNWPEDVKAKIRERLQSRSDSGIYQQSLKLLKARNMDDAGTPEEQGFYKAVGA